MRLAHDFSIWLNLKTSDSKQSQLTQKFLGSSKFVYKPKLKIKHFWGIWEIYGYSKSILALISQIWLLSNKSTSETLIS